MACHILMNKYFLPVIKGFSNKVNSFCDLIISMASRKSLLAIIGLFLLAGSFHFSSSILEYPKNNIEVEMTGSHIESTRAANLHFVFPGYSTLGLNNGEPAMVGINLRDVELKRGFGILELKYSNTRRGDAEITPRIISQNENCHATYAPSKNEFRLRADNNNLSCDFDLQFKPEGMLYPAGKIEFDTSGYNISETSLTFLAFSEYYSCSSSKCINTVREGTRAFRNAYDSHQFENTSQAVKYLEGENDGADEIQSKIGYKAINENGEPISATLFFDPGKVPTDIFNLIRNLISVFFGLMIGVIVSEHKIEDLKDILSFKN